MVDDHTGFMASGPPAAGEGAWTHTWAAHPRRKRQFWGMRTLNRTA